MTSTALASHLKAAHYVMVIMNVIAPAKAERYAEDPSCRRYASAARTMRAWVINDHTIGLTAKGDPHYVAAACTATVDATFCALEGSPYDMPLEQGLIGSWDGEKITFTW